MERCIFNFDSRLLDSSTLLANSAPVFKECPLAVWLSNRLCAGRTQTISLTKIITLSRCRIGKTGFFVPSFVAKGIKKHRHAQLCNYNVRKKQLILLLGRLRRKTQHRSHKHLAHIKHREQTPWTNTPAADLLSFEVIKQTLSVNEKRLQRGLYKTFFFLI